MKFLKNLLLITIIFIPFTSYASYDEIGSDIKKSYFKLYIDLKQKYDNDELLSLLSNLNETIIKVNGSGKLNSSNYKLVSDLQKLNNEKIFLLELMELEEENKLIINNNSLLDSYKLKYYNPDGLVKEDGVWYTYIFEKKYYFESISKIRYEDLEYNGLTGDDVLIYYDENNRLNFVKEYEKKRLIDNDIIYGIPNKYDFLKKLRKNKIFTDGNDDNSFEELKEISTELTDGIYTDSEKIEILYEYLIENIDYAQNFSLEDYEIYSGIETFKNKSGVCEGYVEMLNIMLSFNNIESEIISGDVLNAQDFPNIGHAWIKIGDYYYDPTFDDPVGAIKVYTLDDYSYYKMPEDLFYTNRYNLGETPEDLKSTDLDYREALIKKNLSNLVDKYWDDNYKLLDPFYFRKANNISYDSEIEISDLINIMGIHEMQNFQININGEEKNIKNISYISLTDVEIEKYLKQINYDLEGFLLIKWIKEDNEYEYVISNDIIYH